MSFGISGYGAGKYGAADSTLPSEGEAIIYVTSSLTAAPFISWHATAISYGKATLAVASVSITRVAFANLAITTTVIPIGKPYTSYDFLLYNKRFMYTWSNESSVVKYRSRYNGVRESEKINLECGTTFFDIADLYYRFSAHETLRDSVLSWVEVGSTFPNGLRGDESLIDETLELVGMDTLKADLESMDQRLRRLEYLTR